MISVPAKKNDKSVMTKTVRLRTAAVTKKGCVGRKAADSKGPLKEGDILYSSWGYDQTNVDFFKVVNATEKMVTLQQVKTHEERLSGGSFGSYNATPTNKDEGKPFKRKIHSYEGQPVVAIRDYAHARKWNGEPKHGDHSH